MKKCDSGIRVARSAPQLISRFISLASAAAAAAGFFLGQPGIASSAPPPGTTQCLMAQELNPKTNLYEWVEVCR